ncbi:hypothetical protein ACTXM3_16765 [Glutamicibacter arilaitensis]|nr:MULTISPECIES: hypothetical protein [Glutamicibacter]
MELEIKGERINDPIANRRTNEGDHGERRPYLLTPTNPRIASTLLWQNPSFWQSDIRGEKECAKDC